MNLIFDKSLKQFLWKKYKDYSDPEWSVYTLYCTLIQNIHNIQTIILQKYHENIY